MSGPPRILRMLLWLYPPRHRRRYADEIWEAMRHVHRNRGRAGAVAAAVDVARSAALLWVDLARRGLMGSWRGWGLDARFVLRSLRRSPGYAATTIVVLAAAVAANATVFSYVRGTLLTVPPYADPERVVVVWGSNPENGQFRDVISGPTFVDLAREATTVRSLAAFHYDETYTMVDGRPEILQALEISADFLDALGVQPMLGRDFGDEDRMSGGTATLLVSHAFWRDRLDSDPNVVGRTVELEGSPRTILGVLPEGFEFLVPAPFYKPLRDDLLAAEGRSSIHYHALGRLSPGASAADATVELGGIMHRISREHGFVGWSALVEPLHRVSVAAVRPYILTLAATVALVLLVALVNLATLFRTRTIARRGELSVRLALGAGRARIARVLALETAGLAVAGGLFGLATAPFLLDRIRAMVPPWVAIPDSAVRVPVLLAALDPWVVTLSFAGAVLGALVLTAPGFVAALRARGGAGGARVHDGLRGTRVLVGVEVAVATVLCLGAGLTTRSAAHLLATDVGLEPDGLLTLYFGDLWGADATGQVAYYRAVIEAVEAVPGVRSASTIDYVDFQAEDDYAGISLLDRQLEPASQLREEWRRIGPGLFETAGMEIVRGRTLEREDFEGLARSAVVNEAFAAQHYPPDGDALGRFLSVHGQPYQSVQIVGVVSDLSSLGPSVPPPPMLYVPWQGSARGTQGFYVRVEGDPMSYASTVRDAIWSVDPSQPVTGIEPMSALVGSWVAVPRATRALVSALAGLAMLLAAVGVFGVVAFLVRTRRRELGVRLALGATPDRLGADLLRAVLPVIAIGVGAGLVAGALGARAASRILFEVSPLDPLSMSGALAAVVGAALLATYLPARRVTRIDPVEVIRAE